MKAILTAMAMVLLACVAVFAEGDVTVRITMVKPATGLVQRGDLVRAAVEVTNVGEDAIVIRGIEWVGQLPDTDRWFGSRYGNATFDPIENVWHYNDFVQQLSPSVFASGLLLPEETMRVVKTVRLRFAPQRVKVGFHKLTMTDVSHAVYVKGPVPMAVGGPTRYGLATDTTLKAMKSSQPLGPGQRPVIFPDAGKWKIEICDVAQDLEAAPRDFPLADARAKANIADYTFSQTLGGWVLTRDDSSLLVTESAVRTLPACDLRAFDLIDTSAKEIKFLLPIEGFNDLVEVAEPSIRGPGYFAPGFTTVAKTKLLQLLERARELKLPVKVEVIDPNGLGARAALVIGKSADLEGRRERLEKNRQ